MSLKYPILDVYEGFGFDLVPVAQNQKYPIELEWTSKIHKDQLEWERWLNTGLNIGVKTGICSNITVIDVDQKIIPEELKSILDKYPTFMQETNKGWHYFYKYCPELVKTRIDELKVDIENNGGQVVIHPSLVEGHSRKIIHDDIIAFPEELKNYLLSKQTLPNIKTISEQLQENIITGDFNLDIIEEGNRHNFLLRLGGLLRKEMNLNQVSYTLNIVNKHFCKPSFPLKDLDILINSLEKYTMFDEMELALKVLNYFKIVDEATSRDVREALGETRAEGKQRIDKAIKYLEKEGFLFKKRRIYHLIKKAEWKVRLASEGNYIDFKMPYFDDYAIFRNGDMIVIGGKTGFGKTHISMNIVKRLVKQGKTPYYISLESGARYVDVALKLELPEGSFKHCIHFSPEDIELEDNAITIIDWLLPDDYASTDKLYKHFAEQLVKKGGILIIFAQLMQNGEFFAKNMIDLFPALVTKFLYEDEHGENSSFILTKIREPKGKKKLNKILCHYNWETKELQTKEERDKQTL